MSVCTGIKKISGDNITGDLLEVTIDNSIVAYWFYNYTEALEFLNQEVIVDYRMEIYNGSKQQFIKTFVLPTVVNVLDKQNNFKLFLDQVDNNSNLSFNEISIGETRQGAIVYCTHQEFKSSTNAVWMELIIRDKSMRCAKLRIFDYEDKNVVLEGKYILTALSLTKYGFNSELAAPVPGESCPNPEITIATQFVENFFGTDAVARNYIQKLNLFDAMAKHIDYEVGYSIVRLAMELACCDSLRNIMNDVNLDAVAHALLASYGYLTRPQSVLSSSFNNVYLVNSFPFSDLKIMCRCLDAGLDERPDEYVIYSNIRKQVDDILFIRKGFKVRE